MYTSTFANNNIILPLHQEEVVEGGQFQLSTNSGSSLISCGFTEIQFFMKHLWWNLYMASVI